VEVTIVWNIKRKTGPENDKFQEPEYPYVSDMTGVTGLGLDKFHDPEYMEVMTR